jgi:hypothetical protein
MQEMSSAGNPSLPEVRRRCFPDRSYDRLKSRCVEFSCVLVDHFPTISLGIERLSASAPKPPQHLAASSRVQGRTMVGLAFSRRHVSLICCPSQAAYAKRSAVADTSSRSEGNETATQPTRARVSRTYISAAAGTSSLSSQRASGSRRAEATPTSDDTQVGSLFRHGHRCVTELSGSAYPGRLRIDIVGSAPALPQDGVQLTGQRRCRAPRGGKECHAQVSVGLQHLIAQKNS